MKFTRTILADGIRMELTLETKDLVSHSRLNNRPQCRARIEQGMSIIAQDVESQLTQEDRVVSADGY